ncbi:MAG: TIGR02302 family protein [Paracoccaceae bacterium]
MRTHIRSGLRGEDIRAIRGQLRLTKWSMRAEAVVRAFWPAATLITLLAALALLGVFGAFGPVMHWVLLGLAGAGVAASLVWGGMRLELPSAEDISERLDASNPRRPLAALRDSLAVGRGSENSETIWQTYRDRARRLLPSLTAQWPDLRLSTQDPWALRLLALALLGGGLLAAGGDIGNRLVSASQPSEVKDTAGAQTFDRVAVAEAWATPPVYTGMDTIYLKGGATVEGQETATTLVPQGSEFTLRVTDATAMPELSATALAGVESFTDLGGGLAEARGVISDSGDIVVTLGDNELARWSVEMIPDAVPSIELDGAPSVTVTRALELGFRASDDYGIVAAWAEIAPEGHDPEAAKGLPLPVINFGLPLPISGDLKAIEDRAIRDFTSHPWAGADVMVELYAEDGAAQVSTSGPFEFRLPARRFSNPLARALVEQRRELALDYGEAFRVLDVLQAVMRRPHELFVEPNPGAYLAIRTAVRRLANGIGTENVPDAAPEVIELLWLAALGLEDGNLSEAMERLRQAQEALREALENGTEEDIRKAMEELRAALNEYLQQLAQQQQQNPQQQGQMDPNQQLSQQDLQEMLDRMQEQAESGLRDEAREMLSELSRMLENLQSAQQQQQGQSPGEQAMQELQEMIQRQRDLSDRTFDELRQRQREQQLGQGQQPGQQPGQQGQQQPGWGEGQGRGDEHGQQGQQQGQGRGEGQQPGQQQGEGGLAAEQDALRRELENLSRGLGSDDAAQALEDAARAMGQAREDLQQGQNSDAVRDQMDALDSLNQGADALAQQLQEGQGQTQADGNRRGEGERFGDNDSDPFDRPQGRHDGALDGPRGMTPDQSVTGRARELMEELRRRAAEPERPELELDYFDRLMERF